MQLCWYRGRWYGREGRKRWSLGTKDRDEALRRLKDLERDAAQESAASRDTVAGILDAYIEERADRASIAKIKDAAKALKSHLGAYRPEQIDRQACRDYRQKRKASDGTKRKELGVLQAALRLMGHPVKLELPPVPSPREVFITKAQFERLVAHAEAQHIKTFLYLAWYTAGRKEAVLSLRWDAVDFKRKKIDLGRSVGKKGRSVLPMGSNLGRVLQKAFAIRLSDHVVEWGAHRVGSVRKGFDEAVRRSGLSGVTIHDLRRSAARVMVEAGVPMEAVGQYLGHTNPAVTYRVYARFAPNSKAFLKAAKSLE